MIFFNRKNLLIKKKLKNKFFYNSDYTISNQKKNFLPNVSCKLLKYHLVTKKIPSRFCLGHSVRE